MGVAMLVERLGELDENDTQRSAMSEGYAALMTTAISDLGDIANYGAEKGVSRRQAEALTTTYDAIAQLLASVDQVKTEQYIPHITHLADRLMQVDFVYQDTEPVHEAYSESLNRTINGFKGLARLHPNLEQELAQGQAKVIREPLERIRDLVYNLPIS